MKSVFDEKNEKISMTTIRERSIKLFIRSKFILSNGYRRISFYSPNEVFDIKAIVLKNVHKCITIQSIGDSYKHSQK